jgi:hypothetical protein
MSAARILRVGVTGHRILSDPDGVARRVRAALEGVLRLVDPAPASSPVTLEILSPLAEGADRLVAQTALELPGVTLMAVLPLPADDYREDFATPDSLAEFSTLLGRSTDTVILPPTESREAAYEQVALWIVDRADLLLAIWDGLPARGRGGTAEAVAHAADHLLPIVWIRVEGPDGGVAGGQTT